MIAIGENKERALAQILAETLAHHAFQSIEALAKIHRLQRHEDFQSAGKA